ncbi:MAG: Na+/H+ antiporter subunit E [Thermoanaerobaculia bacterium]|nr:Na(+)/H(+) antiporter subunit E [Thermoanaerobaculia bacterium]MCK6683689.1 Na+/H+ antiporter subunit E [Thermoanaerobaculia bacterium]
MKRIAALVRLAGRLAIDTIRSSIQLAHDVLSPRDLSSVRVLEFQTRARTDLELMLLSCAITLTPGTLTLDAGDDRRTLLIHAMYAADAERVLGDIRERYEADILCLLRGNEP